MNTISIAIFLAGKKMRELTHTALTDVAGRFGSLWDVSVRGDKIVVGGRGGAAIFKLIY